MQEEAVFANLIADLCVCSPEEWDKHVAMCLAWMHRAHARSGMDSFLPLLRGIFETVQTTARARIKIVTMFAQFVADAQHAGQDDALRALEAFFPCIWYRTVSILPQPGLDSLHTLLRTWGSDATFSEVTLSHFTTSLQERQIIVDEILLQAAPIHREPVTTPYKIYPGSFLTMWDGVEAPRPEAPKTEAEVPQPVDSIVMDPEVYEASLSAPGVPRAPPQRVPTGLSMSVLSAPKVSSQANTSHNLAGKPIMSASLAPYIPRPRTGKDVKVPAMPNAAAVPPIRPREGQEVPRLNNPRAIPRR